MVRKSAHANTRSFKPQKLFRATNSFYKAGCALIPVISKIEGRGLAGKSTCLWKRTWDANIVVARCFSPRAHMHTRSSTPASAGATGTTPKHMQHIHTGAYTHAHTHTHTHTHTHIHTPFLEEMSLASSSLRLARESASSSARGRAFSWGAERLCWRWCSPKEWVSASRRAEQRQQMSDMKNLLWY